MGIDLDLKVKKGQELIGEVHTHPYTDGLEGVSFSATDISLLKGEKEGYVSIVESGSKRFGIMVLDEKKAKAFLKKNNKSKLQKEWDKAFDEAFKTENFADAVRLANKSVLKGSGIGFFQTTDDNKTKFEEVK